MLKLSLAIALVASMANSAIAETDDIRQRSFAKAEYYFGAGGQPPTLAAFRINPVEYFRHTMAYDTLRDYVADKLGEPALADPQSDFEFFMLLGREGTDTIDCVGQIHTAGISDAGATWQYDRDCYVKRDENGAVIEREQLVVAKDTSGETHVLFSLWCLNPSKLQPKATAIAVPKVAPVTVVETQSTFNSNSMVRDEPPNLLFVPGFNVCGLCGVTLPDTLILVPGGTKEIYDFMPD